jgi:hypothetical protein
MNNRQLSVLRITRVKTNPNGAAGIVGRAISAGPIETVLAASLLGHHPETNGPTSRAGKIIEDLRVIAIVLIARLARISSMANIVKIDIIDRIGRQSKSRCRRSP